jgi:hypothetical protein
MFDSVPRVARIVSSVSVAPVTAGTRPFPGGRPALPEELVVRALPTSTSASQLLPVIDALAPLLPGRGLQRGTVLLVDTGAVRSGLPVGELGGSGHGGATTLSMALVAAASSAGSWCVAIGFGDPGVVAMDELGVDLDHLAIVPRPGHSWASVTATALDGVDVVLLRLPFPARPAMARNLVARARERRAVLIVVGGERAWPEGPDLLIRVENGQWTGLGDGHGHLRTRRATVMAVGRRAAARPVRCRLWLPGPDGRVVGELGLGTDAPGNAPEGNAPEGNAPEGTVDPAVQHGAVHPAVSRHPSAAAFTSGTGISGAGRMHPSLAGGSSR